MSQKKMKKELAKRLAQMLLVLFGVTVLVYGLMDLAPGDPAQRKLTAGGVTVTKEVLEQTREDMGLNRPFPVRYGDWLLHVLRGDLGTSYRDGQPVMKKLGSGLHGTALLASCSLLLSIIFGIPLGILAAVRRGKWSDWCIRLFSFLGNSLPGFLICVLLMHVFCLKLKWFPVLAKQSVQGLFLPVVTLAIPLASRLTVQVRAEVLRELQEPYVAGAKARGIGMGTILFHDVLHNVMPPILTMLALSVGSLMAGSVVVETIFLWPGLGKMMMDAISARDYPVIQGFTLLMAVLYTVINWLTDFCYRKLDPRIHGEWEDA